MIILLGHCCFILTEKSAGCMTDEIFMKSAINLKRNLAPVSASTFRLTRLHFAWSFAMITRCIVRPVAKCCAKLSHAVFKPGKSSTRISVTASFDIFIASTRYNSRKWQYRAVLVLIITIDYAYKTHRPPRVSNANKAYSIYRTRKLGH